MFSFACPKFVTPSPPNYDAVPGKYHRVFIRGFSIICFSWHSNYNRVNTFSFMVVYQFSKLVFSCYFIGLSKKRGNFSKVLFYYLIYIIFCERNYFFYLRRCFVSHWKLVYNKTPINWNFGKRCGFFLPPTSIVLTTAVSCIQNTLFPFVSVNERCLPFLGSIWYST